MSTLPRRSSAPSARRTPAKAGSASAPGGTALYQQIQDFVLAHIQDGRWPTGHRLPSESALVAQFGVSRMTVNRALRELGAQGRIRRVAGVGSFVAESRPQSTLLQVASIAAEIRARGHVHTCQVLQVERLAAAHEVAGWLDLHPGASVFHSVCLHLEDGVPVQLEDRYVNPAAAPDFLQQDFSARSPGDYLLQHVPLDQIEHVVDAVLPNPEQAELLAMATSEPCLQLTRRTWIRGLPVTLVRCLHPASRYRLGSRIRLDGAASSG